MRRRTLAVLLTIAAVTLASPGAAAVAGLSASPGSSPAAVASASGAVQDGSADRSVVRIEVDADGNGRWTFRYERTLETDAEREEFEAFAAEFRENETDRYRSFQEDARGLVADGENVVDREMSAGNFSRDAFVRSSLGNDIGVVELSFTWAGFAAVEGDRVVVGDVFEGGIYVGPDQELVVVPDEGLAFASVDPPATQSNPDSLADSDSVTWTGERQFTDRRPRVVLRPASAVGTATATDDGTAEGTADATETGSPTPDAGGGTWSDRLPLIAVLLVVLAGAGVLASRSDGGLPGPIGRSPRDDGDDGESTLAGAAEGSPGEVDAAAGETEGAAVETAGGTGAAAASPEPAVPDEELLSDEDRVVRLLREHGGRMKQHRIVDETGWSKSKVSVLLSEMEEEGTVSKLRVGRENVVSLDGFEPPAAGSPFDEE